MFGIGFGEMLIIAVILLIAVGPRQLPQLMKTVGKGMREVKRATNDLRRSTGIDELLNDEEIRNPLRDREPAKPQRQPLRPSDRERESPNEGVDTAHARVQFESSARVPAQGAIAGEPSVEAGGSAREPSNEG
jgi:sec-independent protein translocase protein TatB